MTPQRTRRLTLGSADSDHLYIVGQAQAGPDNAIVHAQCVVGGGGGSACF